MNIRRLVANCYLTVLSLLLFHSFAVAQKQLAPLPIAEALRTVNFQMFTPITLSPDGRLVAYVLQDSTRKAETAAHRSLQELERKGIPRGADYCDVWISDTVTGAAKNLTQSQGTNWAPVWSPDGKFLAFYSDRTGVPALFVWEKFSGRTRRVSSAIVRTRTETTVPRWTPDSKRIVISILSNGRTLPEAEALFDKPTTETDPSSAMDKEPGSTVVLFYSHQSSVARNQEKTPLNSNLDAYETGLAVVDLARGDTRYIANRVVAEGYWLSPDGTNVAILIYKGRQSHKNLQVLFDLLVISLLDGKSRRVVSDFGSDVLIPVSWSPDGKSLAYMTSGPTAGNDCYVVSISGGEPRNVTRGQHPPFENTFIYRGPLWDAAGKNVYLLSKSAVWQASVVDAHLTQLANMPGCTLRHIITHDGRTVWTPPNTDNAIVVTRNEESRQEGLYRLSLNAGKFERLLEENKSYAFMPSLRTAVSSDQRHLVYTSQSAAEPEDIWIVDTDEFRPRRITHINPVFDRYVMGESRMIEWQTLNGQTVRGALLLPAGFTPGKRYPLIVYQYPGAMWSTHQNLFGVSPFTSTVENWQFFATRGYAVLVADVPAKPETYMRDIAAAILPGVDKVIELGICDPDRVGITGQSNGGYGVLSLIVQTHRFKAAVDRMGPGNLISLYTQLSENGVSVFTGEMVQRTGGSLWEKRDKFIENSPIFYFDRVQTPVLIIQGTTDRQTHVAQSDEVFVSLRFLGKEVEYARYVGEPHGVSEWSFPNQVDYLKRVIAWFDVWLKS